jgi:hypothetical protein
VTRRWFRVPLEQIAYVRAIVEGYDGVAVVTAPDPRRGEIEVAIAPGQEAEAERIIARLVAEASLIEIPTPEDQLSRS